MVIFESCSGRLQHHHLQLHNKAIKSILAIPDLNIVWTLGEDGIWVWATDAFEGASIQQFLNAATAESPSKMLRLDEPFKLVPQGGGGSGKRGIMKKKQHTIITVGPIHVTLFFSPSKQGSKPPDEVILPLAGLIMKAEGKRLHLSTDTQKQYSLIGKNAQQVLHATEKMKEAMSYSNRMNKVRDGMISIHQVIGTNKSTTMILVRTTDQQLEVWIGGMVSPSNVGGQQRWDQQTARRLDCNP